MNLLIPAAIAVFLAEWGGNFARGISARYLFGLFIATLLIAASALAGDALAGIMVDLARQMLLGISLLFASFGQLVFKRGIELQQPTPLQTALSAWRSSTPMLVMAISSAYSAPVAAAMGGVVGIAVSAILAGIARPGPAMRRSAGILLLIGGVWTLINVLRTI